MTQTPPPLVCMWMKGPLDWPVVSCLKSAVRHGHEVHLYSYGEIPNMPRGVTHKDAREVVPADEIFLFDGIRQLDRIGSVAPFSDAFRYRALQQARGVWMDSDVYVLRPMDLSAPAIFAWEGPQDVIPEGQQHQGHIGNALLRLPAASGILQDLVTLTSAPYKMPPWVAKPLREDALKKLNGKPFFPGAVTYATVGPVALTYYAKQHGLLADVRPHSWYYPVHFREVRRFGEPDDAFRASLPPQSEATHLWSSVFGRHYADTLPKGSFADRLREESQDG